MLMAIIVVLRSIVSSSAVGFAPVLFERKGWSPAQYGLITSSFWIASAVAGVVFGHLADRYDRRWIIALSLLLAAPSLFFLPVTDGPLAFMLALAAGGLSGGSFSIFVVLAQRILPTGRAFASGAIMGFSFVSGALGTLATGILADGPASLFGVQGAVSGGIGVETTYQIMAAVVVVAGLLTLALPRWVSGRSAPQAKP
jgi:FSR family fosmidomycin resistance protein-like MFS transporter